MIEFIFWLSLIFIVYTYFGYPLILFVWSSFFPKGVEKFYYTSEPLVSIIIAAYNEEKYILARIENLLGQDYSSSKMEIIVVSDGSSDNTVNIVERFLEEKVKTNENSSDKLMIRVINIAENKGKYNAINEGVLNANGRFVVFADARQRFKQNAIKELIANFNDPTVGAVTGELKLTPKINDKIKMPVNYYWKYEKWLRYSESKIDSSVGATGAIYAIRKKLFEPLPVNTLLDDLMIPVSIIFKGYRVVFDGDAIAYDDALINSKREFKRKVRTLTGNYQAVLFMPKLLSIQKNRIFFNFVSHKILRLMVPEMLLILFFSNIALVNYGYGLFLLLQIFFYILAVLGALKKNDNPLLGRAVSVPYTFLLFNFAAFLGLINILKKNMDVWNK